jgi:hypothetical protein
MSVPVIRQLAERLEFPRLRCGEPTTDPMFVNAVGQRHSMNNLLNRAILPVLNVYRHCGVSEGREHLKGDHHYSMMIESLCRLGLPDRVIQVIVRHSNVNVTLGYYIKSNNADVVEAMESLRKTWQKKPLLNPCRTTAEH